MNLWFFIPGILILIIVTLLYGLYFKYKPKGVSFNEKEKLSNTEITGIIIVAIWIIFTISGVAL